MDKVIGFFVWIISVVFAIVLGWSLKVWCTKENVETPEFVNKVEGKIVSAMDQLKRKKAAKQAEPSSDEPTVKRTVGTV